MNTHDQALDGEIDELEILLDPAHPKKMAIQDWASQALPTSADISDGWIVDRATFATAGAYGIQRALCPVELGGTSPSPVSMMMVLEALGASEVDNGVVFALAAQGIAPVRALAQSGSPEQRERWLEPLLAGETFGSFAMTELDAGSDPWMMTTTAAAQTDGSFVLNGVKAWVTLGPVCDMAVVFATTDPTKGSWGVTAFIVDAETEGVERGPSIPKMGLKASPFGHLTFADCHLPATSVLGKVGAGGAIFSRILEAERAFAYAPLVGTIDRSIKRSIDRARSRTQSGVHIGSHQAVSHRIVDVATQNEAARLMLYKSAMLFGRNRPATLSACLAKLQTSEMAVQASVDALRLFGAAGYTVDMGIESDIRDVLGGLAYSGTSDVTRNLVASLLRIDRPAER